MKRAQPLVNSAYWSRTLKRVRGSAPFAFYTSKSSLPHCLLNERASETHCRAMACGAARVYWRYRSRRWRRSAVCWRHSRPPPRSSRIEGDTHVGRCRPTDQTRIVSLDSSAWRFQVCLAGGLRSIHGQSVAIEQGTSFHAFGVTLQCTLLGVAHQI